MTQKIKFNPIVSQKVVEYNIKNLRHLIFEVTDACNLNCKYCGFSEFYNGYDERSGTYQSFEKVKSFIDYLASIWKNCKYENIQQPLTVGFYGGEPLLNMKFIKQVIDHFLSSSCKCNF